MLQMSRIGEQMKIENVDFRELVSLFIAASRYGYVAMLAISCLSSCFLGYNRPLINPVPVFPLFVASRYLLNDHHTEDC